MTRDKALEAAADAGWGRLVDALRDHINNHMDQFDRWQMRDATGNTVYIHLSYMPTAPEEVHIDLDALPPPPERMAAIMKAIRRRVAAYRAEFEARDGAGGQGDG